MESPSHEVQIHGWRQELLGPLERGQSLHTAGATVVGAGIRRIAASQGAGTCLHQRVRLGEHLDPRASQRLRTFFVHMKVPATRVATDEEPEVREFALLPCAPLPCSPSATLLLLGFNTILRKTVCAHRDRPDDTGRDIVDVDDGQRSRGGVGAAAPGQCRVEAEARGARRTVSHACEVLEVHIEGLPTREVIARKRLIRRCQGALAVVPDNVITVNR